VTNRARFVARGGAAIFRVQITNEFEVKSPIENSISDNRVRGASWKKWKKRGKREVVAGGRR